MKKSQTLFVLTLVCGLTSCNFGRLEEKGFQVGPSTDNVENENTDGLDRDSVEFETRPSNVLLTGVPNVRLATIYKVNVKKGDNSTFIGSNSFHSSYEESDKENNWNNNLFPGLKAVYGYNLVNISHFDIKENKQKIFFEKPVLIKTLYYPTFSKDTLNKQPVKRDYFMVSVYNEDTNNDNFINLRDLRRLYLFDINGVKQKALVPENYSVFKAEYDSANDYMFVFAQLDENSNGGKDNGEPVHIFWIDLKDPYRSGRQY